MRKIFCLLFSIISTAALAQHGNFTDLRLINGDSVLAGTNNGTVYYDRTLNIFRFRQNSSWTKFSQPGGSTTQIQFNNSGAFAGNSNLTINNGTGRVTFGVLPTIPLTPSASTDASSKGYVDAAILAVGLTMGNGTYDSSSVLKIGGTLVSGLHFDGGGSHDVVVDNVTSFTVNTIGSMFLNAPEASGSTDVYLPSLISYQSTKVQTELRQNSGFAALHFDASSGDPGTLAAGDAWYNGTVNSFKVRNGSTSSWVGTPFTALGDLVYGGTGAKPTALAGNTVASKKFLTQTGTGSGSAAPIWSAVAASDLPNTAVTAGAYINTNLTVDAQGRITAAASGSGIAGSQIDYYPHLKVTTLTAAAFSFGLEGAMMDQVGPWVFVYGGYNPGQSPNTNNHVWRANISNLASWTQLSDGPWVRRAAVGHGVVGNDIVFWGSDLNTSGVTQADAWKGAVNVSTGAITWTQTNAAIPYEGSGLYLAGGTVHKGKLINMGGQGNDNTPRNPTDSVYSSANEGTTWTKIAGPVSAISERNLIGAVASYNGKIYFGGGSEFVTNDLSHVKYDSTIYVSTDDGHSFTQTGRLLFAGVRYPAVAQLRNKLFWLFGGAWRSPGGTSLIQYIDSTETVHQAYTTIAPRIFASACTITFADGTQGILTGLGQSAGVAMNDLYLLTATYDRKIVTGDMARLKQLNVDDTTKTNVVRPLVTGNTIDFNAYLYSLPVTSGGTYPALGIGTSTPLRALDLDFVNIYWGANEGSGGTNFFEPSGSRRTDNHTKIGIISAPSYQLAADNVHLFGYYALNSSTRYLVIGGSNGVLGTGTYPTEMRFGIQAQDLALKFNSSAATFGLPIVLPAGTASAAPIYIQSGTLNSTTQAGALESNGTHLYFTFSAAGTRYQLDQQFSGTLAESLITFTDITTNNVSTSKHGFAPKLPNDSTTFFSGDGRYLHISATVSGAALTKTNDTNVTATLGGSASTALVNAASITLGWTGQLSVARGGNSIGSYGTGSMLYFSGTSATEMNLGTTGMFIKAGASNPGYAFITASDITSGQVALANGGTAANLSDPGAHRTMGWDDTDNAITFITYGSGLTYTHSTHTLSTTGGGSTALSSITAASGTNTIDNTTFAQEFDWTGLAGVSAFKFAAVSTAAASNSQILLDVRLSGANATSTQTTYGAYISNVHTGTTSTNYGLYVEATGGTTNYAIEAKGDIESKGTNSVIRMHSSFTDASNYDRIEMGNTYWGTPSIGRDAQTSGSRVGGSFTIFSAGSSGYIAFGVGVQEVGRIMNAGYWRPSSDNAYDWGEATGNIFKNMYTYGMHIGGTATPTSTLKLDGSFAPTTASTSTDLTLTIAHYTVKVDASGAARTITLPAASGCAGREYVILKSDSSGNSVTIDGNASETISGSTTKVVNTQWAGYKIQCDGSNWVITSTF